MTTIDLSALTVDESGNVAISLEQLTELQSKASTSEETGLRNSARNLALSELKDRYPVEFKALYEEACTQIGVEAYGRSRRSSRTAQVNLSTVKAPKA